MKKKTITAVLLVIGVMGAQHRVQAQLQSGITSPIVDTGQDRCYSNFRAIPCPGPGQAFAGQDAQYRGSAFSYTDNGNGTITDNHSGLMWQKTPPPEHLSWYQALTYAENLLLGGNDDWRMPTIKELYSLAAFYGNIHTLTPYLDTETFDFEYPDTSQGYRIIDAQYWSSNRYVGTTMFGDTSAFGFNFADGRIKAYPIGIGGGVMKTNYIRAVRGPQGYGENNYLDNGDGTVTDLATGLMWMKADSGTTMRWQEALSYAENLEHAGYEDWRLPNAKELQSIVDYSRAPDALNPTARTAAIDPVFSLTGAESWFWTSTTHNDNGFGIYVAFGRALGHDPWTGKPTVNAHGAGAQRSDPKYGDPSNYPVGKGPQRDQIRIYNYARAVRTVKR